MKIIIFSEIIIFRSSPLELLIMEKRCTDKVSAKNRLEYGVPPMKQCMLTPSNFSFRRTHFPVLVFNEEFFNWKFQRLLSFLFFNLNSFLTLFAFSMCHSSHRTKDISDLNLFLIIF